MYYTRLFLAGVVGHLPSSLPLVSMESDDTRRGMNEGRKPDVGFKSKESDQLLDYLRTVQRAQFRLICIRVSHVNAEVVYIETLICCAVVYAHGFQIIFVVFMCR